MAELDIEALQRGVVREGGCILVYASDWQAIIAALEERKRLREALTKIRDQSNRMLESDEQNYRLRDIARWAHRALEGRDG